MFIIHKYYIDLIYKMFCSGKIIAYTSKNNMGFVDVFKYINYLISSKTSEIDMKSVVEYAAKLKDFNMDILKNLSIKQLNEKKTTLLDLYKKRNTLLKENKEKLLHLKIINDEEYFFYEKLLTNINKILNNVNFINRIKNIQTKNKNGIKLTKNEFSLYSFYKYMDNYSKYLNNFKLGDKIISEVENSKIYKNIANDIVNELKTEINMEISLTNTEKYELEEVLSNWSDEESKKIIKSIDEDMNTKLMTSNVNLRKKVLTSLKKLLGISLLHANTILSDINFREKMFQNVNIDDINNNINLVNIELNEHQQIDDFMNLYHKRVNVCPFCNFENKMGIVVNLHVSDAHKVLAKKYPEQKAVNMFDIVKVGKGFECLHIPTVFDKIGNLKVHIKKHYLRPEIKDEQINRIVINHLSLKELRHDTQITIEGGEHRVEFDKLVKSRYETESKKYNIIMDTKETYRVFLENNVINKTEFSKMEKIIETEFKSVNKDLMTNLSFIFQNIKIHFSKMLIKKYFPDFENDSLKHVTDMLELLFENDLENIVKFEKIFKNTINYENDDVINVVKTISNNMFDFLNSKMKSVDDMINMLYKELGRQSRFIISEQNKMKVKKEITNQSDELNALNYMLLLSYTEQDNEYFKQVVDKINNGVELNNNKSNSLWKIVNKNDNKKLFNMIHDIGVNPNFIKEIMNEFHEEDEEKNNFKIIKNLQQKVKNINKMKIKFNTMLNFFINLYKNRVVVTKIGGNKTNEDKLREYYFGLLVNTMTLMLKELNMINKSKSMKQFSVKNIEFVGFLLEKESKFLKKVEKIERKERVIVHTERDRDDLLNDFMNEDLDFIGDFEMDEEDDIHEIFDEDEINTEFFEEEIDMEELFGED
jgi:hypothetical protein